MAYIGKTIEQQLHLLSGKDSFIQARDLRKNQTDCETILWEELRNRKCNGLKFRRQHPLLSFVADFYCFEKKLVVEVDGSVHNNVEAMERDENRTFELEKYGITVLRFTNDEIKNNLAYVLSKIESVSESIVKQ